jgi:hypothetical protein
VHVLRRIADGAVLIIATTALAGAGLPTAANAASLARPAPLSCGASVTKRYPTDNTTVGVRVRTSASAHILVVAHFKSGARVQRWRADRAGRRTAWYRLGNATPNHRVKVDVSVSLGRRKGSCTTWFTPRRPVRHKHVTAAWCKATATVYYAPYNWNNVYVHSNQPYTDATASADGYSWSYETNASGYALIYLNGPPAGVTITVTVGAATCYTSD